MEIQMTQVIAVIGAQWGDEGKGKIVDFLSDNADYCIRFQGGSNAGHTIIFGGETYKLRLLPSGVLRGAKGVLGAGMAINLDVLQGEFDMLCEMIGYEEASKRVLIDHRAHLILPIHIEVDTAREEKSDNRIGTTRNGIGVCYEDKARRIGLRVGDLLDPSTWAEKTKLIAMAHGGLSAPLIQEQIMSKLNQWRNDWIPFIYDNLSVKIHEAMNGGADKIIIEGAQGTFLDISHGTYPFVTSSTTIAGGISAGIGCALPRDAEIIGVVKAYCTRVGAGPFGLEDTGELGERLRTQGGEFGVVTGRARRCGWNSLPMLREAQILNGFTSLALTKVDVLDGFSEVKIGLKGGMEVFEGWDNSAGVQDYSFLHANLKAYVGYISEKVCPVSIISTGADREDTIFV
jgi:adenylosuccinate synthase